MKTKKIIISRSQWNKLNKQAAPLKPMPPNQIKDQVKNMLPQGPGSKIAPTSDPQQKADAEQALTQQSLNNTEVLKRLVPNIIFGPQNNNKSIPYTTNDQKLIQKQVSDLTNSIKTTTLPTTPIAANPAKAEPKAVKPTGQSGGGNKTVANPPAQLTTPAKK